MTESTVNLAARALCEAEGRVWNLLRPTQREGVRTRVRAVLRGLREPTPLVIEAGRWPAEDDGPLACWRQMIDAALEGA